MLSASRSIIHFDLEFANDCCSYRGPHSPKCLQAIWRSANCIREGHDYPGNVSSSRLIIWQMRTLRWVKQEKWKSGLFICLCLFILFVYLYLVTNDTSYYVY